ncbi:MAG: energy transducer TonB [Prevotellaceae bacterium]|uniref:energy transducer TonB n=1 Tax=Neisseria TaxID=482 RepID=UPI00114CC012|nr:energy transducer TonB [Prevotellaceae bacterium]MBF1293950.1 energy transducer TonB [Neisseria sp.]
MPVPKYPVYFLENGEKGQAILGVRALNSHSNMVRIIESSGYHRLDNAALQALKKSSFISKFEKILNIIGWLNAHSNRFSDDLPA